MPSLRRTASLWLSLPLIATLAIACGAGSAPPTPTPTSTATATATASPTATPTSTPTFTPTSTATPAPTMPPSVQAQVIGHGPRDQMVVALTFDAGSDVGYAEQILNTLRDNHIVASFGMTGQWAERYPALLGRMVDEGHELINHTYDHLSFTGTSTHRRALSQADRWVELDRTEAIVQQLTGKTTLPYFRPPYGDYDASVDADVYSRGYRYNIMWSVDSQGWMGHSANQIVQHCLAEAKPGAIYIFHVGSASQDGPALQRVIDGLRSLGYGFVPISDFAPR